MNRLAAALLLVIAAPAACAAAATPECQQARTLFGQMYPYVARAMNVNPDTAPIEVAAGSALASVDDLPNEPLRKRCYDEIMRSLGRGLYPSYAAARRAVRRRDAG